MYKSVKATIGGFNRFIHYCHLEYLSLSHLNLDQWSTGPSFNAFIFLAYFQSKSTSSKPNSDLSLRSHDAVHDDFGPYIELMKWLKELDHSKYLEIKTVSFLTIQSMSELEFLLSAKFFDFIVFLSTYLWLSFLRNTLIIFSDLLYVVGWGQA